MSSQIACLGSLAPSPAAGARGRQSSVKRPMVAHRVFSGNLSHIRGMSCGRDLTSILPDAKHFFTFAGVGNPVSSRKRSRTLVVAASALPSLGTCEYIEDAVDQLSKRLMDQSLSNPEKRYIIGIAGPPGGGKSTLAMLVRDRINVIAASDTSLPESKDNLAVMVPMDGFHFYRRELDAMDDPEEAHARRGAHWTFDAEAFVDCIHSLVAETERTIGIPSFDHAVGDPVPDDIQVAPGNRIVLVEGNYLLLDMEPWQRLDDAFDETWFVDTPIDQAMDRVFKRQTSIGLEPEVSRLRIATNDKPNAETVLATRKRAGLVVPPLPFKGAVSSS